MISTKNEFIIRYLAMIQKKLEEKLTKEPRFESEYREEADHILKEEVLK